MRRMKEVRGAQASSQEPNSDADDAAGPKPERERDAETRLGSPRVITLSGPIDTDTVEKVADQLVALNAESSKPIIVQILSHGGHLQSGLALYDLFTVSPSPVVTVGYGYIGSAAAFAYQGGSVRLMTRHARLMIHEVSTGMSEDTRYTAGALKARAAELALNQRIVERMLARRSGQPLTKIRAWCAEEKEFSAHEAVKAGLADNMVHGRRLPRPKKRRR